MALRADLQSLLEALLGSEQVFFQPPANVQMIYPAITYKLDSIKPQHADNSTFILTRRYLVTLIDADPDSAFIMKIAALPMCVHNRFFTRNNLNHNVFALHF